jgi:hypothetical protein
MANAIFRRIFPDLGPGPFGTVGFRTSPSDWKIRIREGLEDAMEILLRDPKDGSRKSRASNCLRPSESTLANHRDAHSATARRS